MSVWVEIKIKRLLPIWQLVTLHVSVWVEIIAQYPHGEINYVTLHVSVWVEILPLSSMEEVSSVTLHVSVWVEIELADQVAICDVRSRSTWACELKYIMNNYGIQLAGHAPRERVSWNGVWRRHNRSWKVTLHVSVWVEIASILFNGFSCCSHAPRERVSWNASKRPLFWDQLRHAPRERVSWNRPWWHLWRPIRVTLHVSVWVEIHH